MEKQVCAEGVGHDDGFRMPEFMMQILGYSLHLIREAEPLEFANGFSSGNGVASLPERQTEPGIKAASSTWQAVDNRRSGCHFC